MLENLRRLREAFSGFKGSVEIAYSVKANFNPLVIKAFASQGTMFDVASEEELFFLNKAGADASKVVYSSVSETSREFEYALESGVKFISLGSKMGFHRLEELMRRKKAEQEVLIRVNPDVEPEAKIPASGSWSKFGFSLAGSSEESARDIIRKARKSPFLKPVGIHFHLGSQVIDPIWFSKALDLVLEFLSWAIERFGLEIKVIDVGGGYPVKYVKDVPPLEDFSSLITEKINNWAIKEGIEPTLIVESGRYLMTSAGTLVASVINLKIAGEGQLVILDAGYNLLLDTVLLNQSYPVRVIGKGETTALTEVKLAGNLCDSFDVLIPPGGRGKGIKLPALEIGDLVAFEMVGAYTNVFNLPFNCKTKPPIIFRNSEGKLVMARARENIEDLYKEESPGS
jgi:diaminopimelate decarboxylase